MRPGAERADRFYAVLRLVARFWIWFLFRDVAVRDAGRVPDTGPVLLCVNHPNNLIDSLLVGAVLPRKVHYLATAGLFRNTLLAGFLTRAGAIPVYRRDDDPHRGDRNTATFVACRQALDAGKVLAIYPEGSTHAEAPVLMRWTTNGRRRRQAGRPVRRSPWFRSASPSSPGSRSAGASWSPSARWSLFARTWRRRRRMPWPRSRR